jgi:hypothetical protein
MNERELLADCLRRLNRTGVIGYLTGSMVSNVRFKIWFCSSTVPLAACLPGWQFF